MDEKWTIGHPHRPDAPRQPILRSTEKLLLVQGALPPIDEPRWFDIAGPGVARDGLQMLARPRRVAPGNAPVFGLVPLRLRAPLGMPSLKEFARAELGSDLSHVGSERLFRLGNVWFYICDPDDPDGPLPRIPRIQSAELTAWFHRDASRISSSIYLKEPVVYLFNGVPYPGRAVKVCETQLWVRTNAVLPSLGAHLEVQLRRGQPRDTGLTVIRGGVSRRSDERAASRFKSQFEMKIYHVEDIEVAGVFYDLLTRADAVNSLPPTSATPSAGASTATSATTTHSAK